MQMVGYSQQSKLNVIAKSVEHIYIYGGFAFPAEASFVATSEDFFIGPTAQASQRTPLHMSDPRRVFVRVLPQRKHNLSTTCVCPPRT